MIKNPIRAILQSNASRGIKWIAFSLMVVVLSALPAMLYALLTGGEGSVPLTLLFAAGALLGHIGFIVGLLMLLYEMLRRR